MLLDECYDASLQDELTSGVVELEKSIATMEKFLFLSGKDDAKNCIFSIQSGAGGVDACDWAAKLLRMYLKYFNAREYDIEELDFRIGPGGGIQSCSLMVKGSYAYGILSCEMGVHRLIRMSPFNAQDKRETSFASIDVQPEVEDIDIQIDWDKDVVEDTYRASGPGGQHVNKTESAIRLTHIATNIVVQCQNDRSQHKNRQSARKMMMSKLYQFEESKRNKELADQYKQKGQIGFGNAIRSYFVHPSQRVKDDRTGVVRHDLDNVLNGDLDEFVDAELRRKSRTRKYKVAT